MKSLLLLYVFFGSIYAKAQSNNQVVRPGLYAGGICQDDGLCGTWMIRSDSTFIYTQIDATGMLKSYGIGKWAVEKDGALHFLFLNTLQHAQPVKTEWQGETRASADSIYISGVLKNGDKPASFASVIGDQKTVMSGKDGAFRITQARTKTNAILRIMASPQGLLPVTLEFPVQNNFYTILVQLPVSDSSSCMPAYEQMRMTGKEPGIRLRILPEGKGSTVGIRFLSPDSRTMIGALHKAAAKQPLLSYIIKELIKKISAN